MKTSLLIAGMIVLSGCAAAPVVPTVDLQSYVGDDVSALTDRLGSGTKQTGTDGQTLYKWTKVATIDGIVNGDEFQATQSAQGSSRFNASECHLRATVNAKNIITKFEDDGDCVRVVTVLQH